MHTKLFFGRSFVVVLLLVISGSPGCAIFSSKETQTVIKESQFNWLEVCYVSGTDKPPIQFTLQGTGHIRIKRGSSPLVANDFSQDVANIKWGDIQTDQITVMPADIHSIFQALVSRGLLREPDKDFASLNRGGPTARIIGKLNDAPLARIVMEPELLGFIRDLLKLFDEQKMATDPLK